MHTQNADYPFSTDLDTQQSPLLRVPAELRNRIYELVLSGHSIHIRHSSNNTRRSFVHSLCRVAHAGKEELAALVVEDDDPWFIQHEPCGWDGESSPEFRRTNALSKLELDLLRTCTQVYTECQSTRFSQNAFVFHTLDEFGGSLDFISAQQKHALSSVNLLLEGARTLSGHLTGTRVLRSSLIPGPIAPVLQSSKNLSSLTLKSEMFGTGASMPSEREVRYMFSPVIKCLAYHRQSLEPLDPLEAERRVGLCETARVSTLA